MKGPYTYDEAEAYAKSKGGRLATTQEILDMLEKRYHSKAVFPESQWTAVKNPCGEKDYIQIGDNKDHNPGASHLKMAGGWPSWASNKHLCPTNVCYIAKKKEMSMKDQYHNLLASTYKSKVPSYVNILYSLFQNSRIQTHLKKLILLQNPNLDNTLFSSYLLLQCKSLEHLEIGGRANIYIENIRWENGLQNFCNLGSGSQNQINIQNESNMAGVKTLPEFDSFIMKIKVLKFEYCTHIGDICIKNMLSAFRETLEHFEICRNFYENIARITDEGFDLNSEAKAKDVKDPSWKMSIEEINNIDSLENAEQIFEIGDKFTNLKENNRRKGANFQQLKQEVQQENNKERHLDVVATYAGWPDWTCEHCKKINKVIFENNKEFGGSPAETKAEDDKNGSKSMAKKGKISSICQNCRQKNDVVDIIQAKMASGDKSKLGNLINLDEI